MKANFGVTLGVHVALATFCALVALASPAMAQAVSYKAALNGASEVPPTTSKATGTLAATYDPATKTLTYTITYSGLTGEATGAHFHGPAAAGENAGVAVPIKPPLASPIKGSATLTDAQASDLAAGKWYLNIHTAANKPGEIRGQVQK